MAMSNGFVRYRLFFFVVGWCYYYIIISGIRLARVCVYERVKYLWLGVCV